MPSHRAARAALLTCVVLAVGLLPGRALADPGDTLTVTTCTEGALRTAIADAPDGGTVEIACDGTILLTPAGGSTIFVRKDLTITGTGYAVTIDGGQATSLFVLEPGPAVQSAADLPTLTLRDLTLTRGWSQDQAFPGGGAVYSFGNLVAERVAFTDNHAFNRGGAVLAQGHGSTTIIDSTFDGNSVTCPLDGSGGGAIAVRQAQRTTISGSTFTGNSATGAAAGGAVLAWVSNGFSGFPVEPPASPAPPAVLGGELVVRDSTFTDNRVTVTGFASLSTERMYGGGALASFDHPLDVSDSLFERNTVETVVGYGGAILAASIRDVPTTITTVDVVDNGFPDRVGGHPANGIGGGIALNGTPTTIGDTLLVGNRAFVGGALHTRGGPVEVVDSGIDDNVAGAVHPDDGDFGGGLATWGPLVLRDSRLSGNGKGTCLVLHGSGPPPAGDVVVDRGGNELDRPGACFRAPVPPTPPAATGALSPPTAPTAPGSPVALTGSGFAPFSRVTLVAYSLTAAASPAGAAAAGVPPTDLGAPPADAAGAFSASPVLPGAGAWRVVALGWGPSGSPVSLQTVVLVAAAGVDVAPVVTQQPSSVSGAPGSTVTLTASAVGSPAPALRWQRSTDGGATWTDVPGATGTTLTTQVPAGSASYRVVFTNTAGTVLSAVAVLSGGSGPGGAPGAGPATGGESHPVVAGAPTARGGALAVTGADVLPLAGGGAALVLVGAGLVLLARRRRQVS